MNKEKVQTILDIYHESTNIKLKMCCNFTFNKEFFVYTDASGIGLGGVLCQKDDENQEYVIPYRSRLLKGAESHYTDTELPKLEEKEKEAKLAHFLGHFDLEATYKRLKQNFYWKNMRQTFKKILKVFLIFFQY